MHPPDYRATRARTGKTFLAYVAGLVLILVLTMVNTVYPQERVLEHQVKAAFLYKFGNYIDWPEGTFESEDDPLTIGVIGADDLAEGLREIVRDKTIKGRPVVVRTLESTDSLQTTHILFIGRATRSYLNSVIASTRGKPIVTVTETEDPLAQGGIINFIIDNDKVRFDIELAAANTSNIKISARLLGVARKVITATSS